MIYLSITAVILLQNCFRLFYSNGPSKYGILFILCLHSRLSCLVLLHFLSRKMGLQRSKRMENMYKKWVWNCKILLNIYFKISYLWINGMDNQWSLAMIALKLSFFFRCRRRERRSIQILLSWNMEILFARMFIVNFQILICINGCHDFSF